ncbi:MAG: DUF2330 domain-containing protein [Candidatus Saccharibacteria bacterium]
MIKSLKIKFVLFIYVAILFSGLFISIPTQACACGMLIAKKNQDIAMKGERGIVIFDNTTQKEQMVIDFQLSGTSDNSALIVPTPVKSEIGQVKKIIFSDLMHIVSPPVSNSKTTVGMSGDTQGVEVLERQVVGSFEIATLKTNSYTDLASWTTENGFNLEPEAEGPVSVYIDNGFILNVIKLKKDSVDSEINPLLFTFNTSKYFYPLMVINDNRNDLKDKSLTLFLITNEPVALPVDDTDYYFAEPLNKETSKITLDDEITKTNEADFSNLDFTSDNYFITLFERDDYSTDSSLVQVLGNSTSATEFAPSKIDNEVKKEKEQTKTISIWSYLLIGVIVIATAGVMVYYFWKKRQISVTDKTVDVIKPDEITNVDSKKPESANSNENTTPELHDQ